MKKKIKAFILCLAALFGVLMPSGQVFADPPANGETKSCDAEFLGLRPWYYGLTEDPPACNIKKPTTCGPEEKNCDRAGDELAKFIWTIILNILIDMFVVAGLVAIGFVIYGGYLYLRSGGDPNFAAKGQKTLTAALVGFLIVTLANVISRLIVNVLIAK